ncbi:MAG: response regulator transcription factor [Actinomycetota bacterium]
MNEVAGWGFIFVEGDKDRMPEAWRQRARNVTVVPLLSEEAEEFMSGHVGRPELDGQELDIARLAARGMTIREISHQLRISQRSVERGIARLRERFGIASKQELATFLASRGFNR